MKILIVDDEQYALQGLLKGIDWPAIGMEKVHTARNIGEAKQIILTNEIHILLCDIEMPNGNGLELIKWVKDNFSDIISICLTCHSDFNYSQQALKLGCFDYVLKPVPYKELDAVLKSASTQYQKNIQERQSAQAAETLLKHRSWLTEQFWQKVLFGVLSSREVQDSSQDLGIDLSRQEYRSYAIVMLAYAAGKQEQNNAMCLLTIKSLATEYITLTHGYVLHTDAKCLTILLPQGDHPILVQELHNRCLLFKGACATILNMDVQYVISEAATLSQLPSCYIQLMQLLHAKDAAFPFSELPPNQQDPRSIVDRIKSQIMYHLCDDLSVADLAASVFLNPDYLTRIFKKQTGITLMEYIVQQRMEVAKHLLKNTCKSVSNIASEVNYSSFSYFAKVFRKYTGVTPMEYRNSAKK